MRPNSSRGTLAAAWGGRFRNAQGWSRQSPSAKLNSSGASNDESFANPCWMRCTNADGSVTEGDPLNGDGWYVDLVTIESRADRYTFRDLYIDLMVPTDGSDARMLDLDEY